MVLFEQGALITFCAQVLNKCGLPVLEAENAARVLVAADARNIHSHGTGRLCLYKTGLEIGQMKPNVSPTVLRQTPISKTLDANGAMGQTVSLTAMRDCIDMAKTHGAGFCAVRNANHFGIAGYYAEMAAKAGFIGVALTNTAALAVPTFGRDAMFGTNPIAVAMPASKGRMFSLDMATTCVTRGKVELYDRSGKALPLGWAVDATGNSTTDAARVLSDTRQGLGGGMLPLGGEGEEFSGHKGYGLAVLVDILCSVLSGGLFGKNLRDNGETSGAVGHFFAALDIEMFRDKEEFMDELGQLLDELTKTRAAQGCERVYYAGLKEHEAQEKARVCGVPVEDVVYLQLKQYASELDLSLPKIKA